MTRFISEALELADILRESWGQFQHAPGTLVNESSGAPAALSEGDGEGESGEGGEGEGPEPVTRDFVESAFDQRFDQLRNDLPSLLDTGEQGGEGGEQEGGQPDYAEVAQRLMDEAAQAGEITPESLQQIVDAQVQVGVQQAMQTVLPEALQQALAPVHDRFLQQEADELEERYPALRDDQQLQQAVVQEAVQFADSLGVPELARSPQFIEKMYLAKMAREGKTAAVPASGDDAALEGAGAAQGGGGDEEPSVVDQIVNAGGRGGDLFQGAF